MRYFSNCSLPRDSVNVFQMTIMTNIYERYIRAEYDTLKFILRHF